MKFVTIGTAIIAMLSLLMLAFLNFVMLQGVFYMFDGTLIFPSIIFLVPIAVIGIVAVLYAIAAAFLQLRRARPKLTRAAGLSAASFYAALFSFFWISFIIIDIKDILSAEYLAGMRADMAQILLLSFLWIAGLMIAPFVRNWLGTKYAR